MGLLDGIIQPLYGGFVGLLMSPAAFLQRPLRWLQAISRYRVTHSGGPNFAYDLCARKINADESAPLDLSSWRVAYNGAEPVRRETLERFAERFAPCGFRPQAFHPAYGLAEATLKVSGGRVAAAPVFADVKADALLRTKLSSNRRRGGCAASGRFRRRIARNRNRHRSSETRRRVRPMRSGNRVKSASVAVGTGCEPKKRNRPFARIWPTQARGRFFARGFRVRQRRRTLRHRTP